MTRSAASVQRVYPKMEQWWPDSFPAVLAVLTSGSQSNQVCVGGGGSGRRITHPLGPALLQKAAP